MNTTTLQEELAKLEDARRGQGQRHKIEVVLMVTIMATMSGYFGYRAIGDFVTRYRDELLEYLKPQKDRLPALATVRRVLMSIDSTAFASLVERWIGQHTQPQKEDWISVDGKAIRGTAQQEEDKKLAHLVTFFRSDSKEVLMQRQTATKSNEIPLVQQMLQSLGIQNVVLTLDAMHCQSQTLEDIKRSGNDYVVGVKSNQKNF